LKEPINSYRDLRVWQEAMSLAEACYFVTKAFPREELFGMSTQIRRSAASVPANIAEGYGRESTKAYQQFLRVAQGSLKELETHLLLAVRVEIASPHSIEPALERCQETGKMLRGLIRSLEKDL